MRNPMVSILVVFHNMRREAARTLLTLSADYQRGVDPAMYEVIALDNGSEPPLEADFVGHFGPNFSLVRLDDARPSPAGALNHGIRVARGELVLCLIDGARMLSPGVLRSSLEVSHAIADPFIHTIGLHLGPDLQNRSMLSGYGRCVEDRMLDVLGWQQDGYRLFDVASMAASSVNGFLGDLAESNCCLLRAATLRRLGGFDERFTSPGGGLVNLHFFNTVMEDPRVTPVRLLGEASFHQFHGGVATNVAPDAHPWDRFAAEYARILGRPYACHKRRVFYFGDVAPQARRLINPGN